MSGSSGLQIVMNTWISQAIYVAAKLQIADILHEQPLTAENLAARIGTHPDATARLLRMLASVGYFCEQDDGRYANTESSSLLRDDIEGSQRPTVISMLEFGWKPWGELLDCVKTGQPAFPKVYGKSRYEVLDEHPDVSALFDRAMSKGAEASAAAIANAYDFSLFRRIVDVGGGDGTLLAAVLRTARDATGVLFDRPSVLGEARKRLASAGVANRCELVGGDFFIDPIPAGDALLLKSVLHNWNDESATKIVARCGAAMAPGARLFLIEPLISRGNDPDFNKLADVHMLVMHGGRERSLAEYEQMFAGFRIVKTIKCPMTTIVEAELA
jgi:hypothetical protein